jgi:succinoglycan biosynthesis transport protein ExoP
VYLMDDSRSDLLEAGWSRQPFAMSRLVGMVRRQILVVLAAFAVAVALGWAYIVLSVPQYTATSSIYAQLDVGLTETTSSMQLDTHVELIGSDRTTSAVIDELGLDDVFDTRPGLLRRTVVDLRRWLGLEIFETLSESDEHAEVMRRVRAGLEVGRVGNTAIIDIAYTSPSKALGVAVANAFAAHYVDEVDTRAAQSAESRVSKLQARAAEVMRRTNSADEHARNLRFRANLAIADAADLERQIADLKTGLTAADGDEAGIRARLASIPQAVDGVNLHAAALQTPEAVELYNRYVAASTQLDQLRSQPGASAATLAQFERATTETREALARALQYARGALELELAVVAARRSGLLTELNAISSYARSPEWSELLQAEREAEVYEGIYRGYLDDLERAYGDPPVSDVRLVSNALSPLNPSFPNYKVVLALAGTIGLFAGLGIAMYREWSRGAV